MDILKNSLDFFIYLCEIFHFQRHVTFPNVNYDIETIKLRERIWWDIRQGMVGANTFHPRHAVIVTWKNVSQADVVRSSRYSYLTNSFQMILATDEHQTYVIFNYIQIQWDGLRDRKAGTNDSTGMPAFVIIKKLQGAK